MWERLSTKNGQFKRFSIVKKEESKMSSTILK